MCVFPPNDLLYYHSIIYNLTISFWRVSHQFVERFRSNNTQASSVLDSFPVVLSTRDFAGLTSSVGLVKLHTSTISNTNDCIYPPNDSSLYLIQYYLASSRIPFGASVTLASFESMIHQLLFQQITSGDIQLFPLSHSLYSPISKSILV